MSDDVWLLRHGDTDWTQDERHTGRRDLALSDAGRTQATRAGRALMGAGIDHVLVSPQLRARQTCELAGFAGQAVTCAELVEWDYGEVEGLTDEQTRERQGDWSLFRDGAPGGESVEQVMRRVTAVLTRVRALDGSCLLVGHGKMLRALGAGWLGADIALAESLPIDPAAICRLQRDGAVARLRLWNYTAEMLPGRPG